MKVCIEFGVRGGQFAESYKEELLKEVGEPTCRVSTTGIITNQTNAPLEPGLELYTADQLIAARKGLEEEIERLSERRCEICGYAEHHREHTGCLRTQLAAAQEELRAANSECDLFRKNGRISDANEIATLKDQLEKAEQRVAEAIHDMTDEVCAPLQTDDKSNDYWHGVGAAAIAIENAIVAFEWRKFVKEV